MQNDPELDGKYLGTISQDFVIVSDTLKEASYQIRKRKFSEYYNRDNSYESGDGSYEHNEPKIVKPEYPTEKTTGENNYRGRGRGGYRGGRGAKY